jgi:hypothetical protein
MTAIALNIHEFYNDLKGAGFTEQQAEVIANIQSKTATATIEQTKHDYRLDDITTNKDLDARISQTELKIKETELRIVTQLAAIQQDMQNTKITNRALLALCALITGALIKIAIF